MAKEASVEKKLAMVLAAAQPGVVLQDLCDEAGVHRDTLNTWRRRFDAEGVEGLLARSRRPHRSPGQTSAAMEDAIVLLRKELPVENGADVIGWHLRRMGHRDVPSDRTIHRVLVRRGLVDPQPQKRPKSAYRRFEFDRPNECWQIDATDWMLRRGRPVTVMDIIDDHSRVLIGIRVGGRGPTTALALETVFDGGHRWGLPASVLSDNGTCFAGRTGQAGGTSEFETVLAAAGIRVFHARPYHPQTCGKVESFHKSLKRWLATQPLAGTIVELQAQLDRFADYYNHQRRHGATGELTPGERHAAGEPATNADQPLELPKNPKITITAAVVEAAGTLRIGKQWRTSVGTEHTGRRLTIVRYGQHAVILDGATILARHHLDPDRTYLPSGRPRGGPRRRPY